MVYLGRTLVRIALAVVASVGVLTVAANPASAAVNDSFEVWTTSGGCGSTEFVDYGKMNGSNNDDFILVHDYCADSHGVRGYVRTIVLDANGNPRVTDYGSRYNGLGYAGPPVAWDPFGNVLPRTTISIRACLVDGASDTTPFRCSAWKSHTSVDG